MVASPEPYGIEDAAFDVKRRSPDERIAGALVRGYEGYIDRREHGVDRHLPTTFIPVIIGFGSPMFIRDAAAPAAPAAPHTAFVAGMFEAPSVAEVAAGGRGVQVDFTPIAAYRFFGVPMHELANRIVDLPDVFGPSARTLVEQLQAAPTWARRFDLIDAFILPRLHEGPPISREVVHAWRRLALARGNLHIGELAAEAGWSRKHFIERFREHVGLPPKAVARIMRFNHALRLLQGAVDRRWVDVAHAAGYYDQAHMIRDFRQFAGVSPTEFARSADHMFRAFKDDTRAPEEGNALERIIARCSESQQ